ncbi:MAG: MlaD family protein, partial [Methyloceanibacter sp.]
METRARYALIGMFMLAVIAASFAFVYWLENKGGFGQQAYYRVRFENSVSGLLVGSAVLFNGIRVGEVTALTLDP